MPTTKATSPANASLQEELNRQAIATLRSNYNLIMIRSAEYLKSRRTGSQDWSDKLRAYDSAVTEFKRNYNYLGRKYPNLQQSLDEIYQAYIKLAKYQGKQQLINDKAKILEDIKSGKYSAAEAIDIFLKTKSSISYGKFEFSEDKDFVAEKEEICESAIVEFEAYITQICLEKSSQVISESREILHPRKVEQPTSFSCGISSFFTSIGSNCISGSKVS